MALPNGFLDELRSRVSIAQVAGRKVTWDSRKSTPGKGDYWAPCPFHQEKTASFHIDDRKGFYYCFGCHAKGDAVTFLRETENMGFMEAVEVLAREAGMAMPARDPRAAAKAAARAGLAEVMEMAVQFCRLQLSAQTGAEARAYLDRRGLDEAARARFELGWVPNARRAMTEALLAKSVPEADIVAAGIAKKPDDGGPAYDRFRGRIMFPIRDARDRAIGFGGRSLDPNARAKYLNSPETELFDKGRALYHHGPAREAAGKAGALILAEGYMDVIALAEAGFAHSVAPLGTAVTEDQLRMAWRMADEPVLALDGDTAGLRAAMRVIDLALPLLEAGKGLRICLLPDGQDPDDVIRSGGAPAMQALLEAAQPMVALLWRRETEGKSFDSPERRAALDATLRDALARIRDPIVRSHYRDAIREFRRTLFRPASGPAQGFGRGTRTAPPSLASDAAKRSLLARDADPLAGARVRETAILWGCLNHPDIAEEMETALDDMRFRCGDLDRMRQVLLQALAGLLGDSPDKSARLRTKVEKTCGCDLENVIGSVRQVHANPHLAADATPDMARLAISEEIEKHRALFGHQAELAEAETEIAGFADEGLTWRVGQAAAVRFEADRGQTAPGRDVEAERAADAAELQAMLDEEIWVRKKK
ncbi:MAG: DNA primase [Pseudomonadota bacterium]